MFNALTATATVLVVFLTVEFIAGLVKLWNESAVTTAAVTTAAVEADVWDGTISQIEFIAPAPQFEFNYQFCLPAAVEADDNIYAASQDLTEYIADYANTAPLSMEVANYASATLESQTIRQLKALAKERGLKKYSYLTKAELITALM